MAQGVLTGDRQAFFSAIRNNIKTPPEGKAKRVENPMDGLFTQRETTVQDRHGLREHFIQEWTALGGQAYSVANRDELAQKMKQIIQERSIKQAMRWDHPELEKLNLEEIFADAQSALTKWPVASRDSNWKKTAASMEAGIVWPDIVMGDSGTVVLPQAPGQSTSVCVLPITFIAVCSTAQLVDGFAQVMTTYRQRYGTKLPTTLTFITGPSRTTDIEMDLTIGVHGAKYVYALILDE